MLIDYAAVAFVPTGKKIKGSNLVIWPFLSIYQAEFTQRYLHSEKEPINYFILLVSDMMLT